MLTITRRTKLNTSIRQRDPPTRRAIELLESTNVQPIDFNIVVDRCIEHFQSKEAIAVTCRRNIVKYFNDTMNDINFNHDVDPIIFEDNSSPRSLDSEEGVVLVTYSSSDEDGGDEKPKVKRCRADTSNIDLNHEDFIKFLRRHLKRIVADDTTIPILECGRNRSVRLVTDCKKKEILRRVFQEAKIRSNIYKDWIVATPIILRVNANNAR